MTKNQNVAAISAITDSISRGELVVVIGAGVSLALTNGKQPALSWKGLIQDGFAFGLQKGKIASQQADFWKPQLESTDLDDILGAAEFMGRKLEAPQGDLYARWLENVFKAVVPENAELMNVVRLFKAARIPLCTLNYDTLLETVTGLPTITLGDIAKVSAWMRRENGGILHLHGSWDLPTSCILGIRDYETTINDDLRDLIQRSLGAFKRLLFIGCGDTFADPNFSALIKWLREKMKTAAPQHYALVGDADFARRHADPSWRGFVDPINYGVKHEELSTFLAKNFTVKPTANPKRRSKRPTIVVSEVDKILLSRYRAHLINDCGEMTIEGVKAGIDASQRRFNLERLFVPLTVLACPPEFPQSDPEREEKLARWYKVNARPQPFGDVFKSTKRIALLALPGGGKTLLLKRLAVAYADSSRRLAIDDGLPELDLTPVLIRCREWREHLHLPLITLLGKLPDITGQPNLVGLRDALLPLFKNGRALLLVDGLDEIHHDATRANFVDRLDSFLREYPNTRLVVTSRVAGFSLVAPQLTGFCARWRIAPLENVAISTLCRHWHRLMGGGDSAAAQAEGDAVAKQILNSRSLHRLAENPLLLTMLLVVKHGAGRLPPDRVSLYGRAVELLLDTWNIQGHDPLNPKEAVPQLAYLAFQMMRDGKQTITADEIIALLEEARDQVPFIKRYASDKPVEFLKRVEVRSSLLVEAGHQAGRNGLVPFYQFRHLTFQEYLAAVAAVEGYYVRYQKGDTVLTPLTAHLVSEEWKEVIPMAVVLARKQAEPLFAALVKESVKIRQKLALVDPSEKKRTYPGKLPAPIVSILQCLIEEAEAAPETLTEALQLVVYFAHGCRIEIDWTALVRGPYGEELINQALLLYRPLEQSRSLWILNTCASILARRKTNAFWLSNEGRNELMALVGSLDDEEIIRGLLSYVGLIWNDLESTTWHPIIGNQISLIERHLFNDNSRVWVAAVWLWAFMAYRRILQPDTKSAILDRLLSLWLSGDVQMDRTSFALATQLGLPRQAWKPRLTDAEIKKIKLICDAKFDGREEVNAAKVGYLIAFHSGKVFEEKELAKRLNSLRRTETESHRVIERDEIKRIDVMLEQMGEAGQRYLRRQSITKGATAG